MQNATIRQVVLLIMIAVALITSVKINPIYAQVGERNLEGHVTDAATGNPMQTFTVTATQQSSPYQKYETGPADASGLYMFMLPQGYYGVEVLSTEYSTSQRVQVYVYSAENGGTANPVHKDFAISPWHHLEVPYHSQPNWYYCGPACLEMVFDYYGADIPQNEIADAARTDGTYPSPFGSYMYELRRAAHFSDVSTSAGESATHVTGYTARQLGYAAFENSLTISSLKTLIDAGYPIVVLQYNAPTHEWGHFRVVVGYDDIAQNIIVHDPLPSDWTGYGKDTSWGGPNNVYSYATFNDLWAYSSYKALFISPWQVSVSSPASAVRGSEFAVSATATYPRPSMFTSNYPASSTTATIELPAGLSLAPGETSTKTLGTGAISSGNSATAQWTVRAETSGTYTIAVEAEGRISGSVTGHGVGQFLTGYSYNDGIGGEGLGSTQVVGAQVWPADEDGNIAIAYIVQGYLVNQEAYVKGAGLPPSTPVTIYIMPSDAEFLPNNAVASATSLTEVDGDLPVTFAWSPPLTLGEYDIWVDVNQNNALDGDDYVGGRFMVVSFDIVPNYPHYESTATGTGGAYLASDSGTITAFTAVDEATLPTEGKPQGVTFPHGLFSFTIEGLTPGATVTVYLQLPLAIPIGSQYWKYQEGLGWFSVPIGSDDGDSVITITLTDGGTGDADATANGVIVDPGGVAAPLPNAWSTDSLGNPKNTFLLGEEVYVKGSGLTASRDVTIYIIPDDQTPVPSNAVANHVGTTDSLGAMPTTLTWSPTLTVGQYDIWIDANQNDVYDAGDALNDKAIGVFSFNVVPEVPLGTAMVFLSMIAALLGFIGFKRYRSKLRLE